MRRRKKAPKTNKFPDRSFVLKEALDLLIYPIAIIAPLALVPQVYKLYKTQDPAGLALSTWLILGTISLIWVLYGKVHKEPPIVITHLAFTFLNFALAAGIVLYR